MALRTTASKLFSCSSLGWVAHFAFSGDSPGAVKPTASGALPGLAAKANPALSLCMIASVAAPARTRCRIWELCQINLIQGRLARCLLLVGRSGGRRRGQFYRGCGSAELSCAGTVASPNLGAPDCADKIESHWGPRFSLRRRLFASLRGSALSKYTGCEKQSYKSNEGLHCSTLGQFRRLTLRYRSLSE